jgi:histidyl-tRNA synthetase
MVEFQTVRGMRDFGPEKAAKKQWIEAKCRAVFERYGFVPLETPIVEDYALLAKKGSGGEAIKEEIYYFKDKSGRELGLRFDLTVPLARFVAANKALPKPFKRYQIGPVYRYDRPGLWRYRSLTQADWDIVGAAGPMADFEIIAVAIEAMKELGFKKGEFKVRVNSRKLLEEVALCCKIPRELIVECFRCLDKLDKIGEEGVKKELKEKGIDTQILGQLDAAKLKKMKLKNAAPLKEMEELLALLKKNGLSDFVEFDLSLARGLEYYTGVVFEVCVKGKPSLGGGGRYDKLVEGYGGQATPAVGCSLGVDRLLNLLEGKIELQKGPKVLVVPVGKELQGQALDLVQKVRSLGVNASMDLNARGISKNLDYANKLGIPFVVILGEKELKAKEFSLKEMKTGKESKVKLADLKKLVKLVG